jgi:glycosyltransferase involved in cell wall biosynthesis
MKVLIVSLYHPELVRGGAQQVSYELFKSLKGRTGIEPLYLAAIDPTLKAYYKAGAQITGFDGRDGEFLFLSRDYDYTWHKVGNSALVNSFAEFLELTQPDVVHFHHFLLLGIDLLTLTRRILPRTRIVLTFHDFMAICDASGQMVRRTDQSLCNKASPARCNQCFPERSPESFFVREKWLKKHLTAVDAFTVPSRFMKDLYLTWGIAPAKLHHVTNGQPNYSASRVLSSPARSSKRNRFGFFGQRVDNKGVWVILGAVRQLRARGFTDLTVEINGDNLRFASDARRLEFEQFLTEESRRPIDEQVVIYNGSYSVDQLPQRMSRIDWCLVPSTWWEIFGLVISEAWMFKRPVIASNAGGPAERIVHEKNGLHFELGSPAALAETLVRACTEKGLWEKLVKGIEEPASDQVMTSAYLSIYGDTASKPNNRRISSMSRP